MIDTASAPRWRRALDSEPALGAAAGLLALLAAGIVLQLWHARPGVPLGYGGDGLWLMQVVKGMIGHGWFWTNPDVGAPFGQELYDFTAAFADTWHFAAIKLLSVFSHDPVKVVNAYFLLGIFLCAAASYLVMRKLGVSRGASVVASVLFSLLPSHLAGGLGRLTLGAYWSIPMTALLIMRVYAGEPLFASRPGRGPLTRWLSRRSLATVALCVLIAGSGLYYALFTVMLLGIAAVAVALLRRDLRAMLGGVLAAVLVLGVFAVNLSPSLIYAHRHGPNTAFERPLQDGSIYATSLTLLVAPFTGHRFEPASKLAAAVQRDKLPPGPNEHQLSALGLIGSLGFLGLLLAIAVPGAGRARERAGPSAATALTAFLLGTSGGIGLLVNVLATPDLRGWGRISPLLGFVGLFAAATAYDGLRRRSGTAGARPWKRYAIAALLPLALVVGIADQTTPGMVPEYAKTRAEFVSDARFVAGIERQLPARASVLQLPTAAFPEGGPIVNMADYSHMRGPLHARDLHFSYGSMKGRPHGNWVERVAGLPPADSLPYYVAAGFRGIWVDRRGYADQGAVLDADLRAALGETSPLQSDDGQLRFYPMVDYARRWQSGRSPQALRRARDSALNLSELRPGPGVSLVAGTSVQQIDDPSRGGSLTLFNPGEFTRTIRVSGRLSSPTGKPVAARFELLDGRRLAVQADKRGRRFAFDARVSAGTEATVRVLAPGARAPLQLSELKVTDRRLRPR